MDLDGVAAELDALEVDGARGFDPAACDCIRTLLVHSAELGPAVAARLIIRAMAHVRALEERLRTDRARVAGELAALETARGEALPELHARIARGEITHVARTVRRLRQRPSRPAPLTALARIDPNDDGSRRGQSARSRIGLRQKKALAYEDSVAELVASFALARAVDVVPDDAGPYNALRIASAALDEMRRLSPIYLTVQLNRLEELASLLALPELPQKAPALTALPRKKPNAAKGRA